MREHARPRRTHGGNAGRLRRDGATWRDFIAATGKAANGVVHPSPHAPTFGCAYASNSYWKAWWNNDVGRSKPLAHDPEKCERFSD
jgi:hypothetical protein